MEKFTFKFIHMIFVASLYLHRQVAQREERRGEKIGGFICIVVALCFWLGSDPMRVEEQPSRCPLCLCSVLLQLHLLKLQVV